MKLYNGLFHAMTLKEQVEMVQDTCIIMGAHGAGLTHVMFAPDGMSMFELQPPAFARGHFIAFSYWSSAFHHLWSLKDSTPDPDIVHHRLVGVVAKARPHFMPTTLGK